LKDPVLCFFFVSLVSSESFHLKNAPIPALSSWVIFLIHRKKATQTLKRAMVKIVRYSRSHSWRTDFRR